MTVRSVAHLTFSGSFGGRERVAFSLSELLAEHLPASVLYLAVETRADPAKRSALLRRAGEQRSRVRRFDVGGRFSRRTAAELWSALREDGVEVVHCHCHKSASYLALLKALHPRTAPRATFTLHGLHLTPSAGSFAIRAANALSLVAMDGVIGCSREIVAGLGKMPSLGRKVEVIQNCLAGPEAASAAGREERRQEARRRLSRTWGIGAEGLWVGAAGRLTAVKNYDLLLSAVRALADEAALPGGVRFLVAGEGELEGELRGRAEEWGLADRVTFLGFVEDMGSFYDAVDAFAMTSVIEGTPMAVLEAMSRGVPVVASAVGGLVDVLEHGRTGLLFPSGDAAAITSLLRGLLADDDVRRELGRAGAEAVRVRFGPERWAAAHLAHYESLLARGRRP